MENETIIGIGKLLNYGVLGIMSVLFITVIYYLNKQNKDAIVTIMDAKDKEIGYWKKTSERHDSQMDTALNQLSENSTKTLELFERQQTLINDIPQRTADKIRLMNK